MAVQDRPPDFAVQLRRRVARATLIVRAGKPAICARLKQLPIMLARISGLAMPDVGGMYGVLVWYPGLGAETDKEKAVNNAIARMTVTLRKTQTVMAFLMAMKIAVIMIVLWRVAETDLIKVRFVLGIRTRRAELVRLTRNADPAEDAQIRKSAILAAETVRLVIRATMEIVRFAIGNAMPLRFPADSAATAFGKLARSSATGRLV